MPPDPSLAHVAAPAAAPPRAGRRPARAPAPRGTSTTQTPRRGARAASAGILITLDIFIRILQGFASVLERVSGLAVSTRTSLCLWGTLSRERRGINYRRARRDPSARLNARDNRHAPFLATTTIVGRLSDNTMQREKNQEREGGSKRSERWGETGREASTPALGGPRQNGLISVQSHV